MWFKRRRWMGADEFVDHLYSSRLLETDLRGRQEWAKEDKWWSNDLINYSRDIEIETISTGFGYPTCQMVTNEKVYTIKSICISLFRARVVIIVQNIAKRTGDR